VLPSSLCLDGNCGLCNGGNGSGIGAFGGGSNGGGNGQRLWQCESDTRLIVVPKDSDNNDGGVSVVSCIPCRNQCRVADSS
jgi:hypothetical protein